MDLLNFITILPSMLAEGTAFGEYDLLGRGLGAGLAALAAGLGIAKIASASVESIARQPEAAGDIKGAMILTSAFIEGVCLFAVVVALIGTGASAG